MTTYRAAGTHFTVRDGQNHSVTWFAINQTFEAARRRRRQAAVPPPKAPAYTLMRNPRWL
jgi:hypothetical protein